MKKFLKVLLAVLLVILIAAACVAGFFALRPDLQMKLMADYMFRNISEYNWELLIGSDPVMAALEETLGEDKPETCSAVYNMLKSHAGELEWNIVKIDKESASLQAELTYSDGSPMLAAYADELSAYICDGIRDGSFALDEAENIIAVIPDETNAAMISSAGAVPLTGRQSSVATVWFEKKIGFVYVPGTISDELNDAVSCGLISGLETMPELVTASVVRGMMENVFADIKAYDIENLGKLIDEDMSSAAVITGYPMLSSAIHDFMAQRAAAIDYSIGEYDMQSKTIPVECSYTDGSAVLSEFMSAVTRYAFTHLLTNPVPDDAALSELFKEAAAAVTDYPRIDKTLIFRIDTENGEFSVPPALADAVTANLASTLGKAITLMNSFM